MKKRYSGKDLKKVLCCITPKVTMLFYSFFLQSFIIHSFTFHFRFLKSNINICQLVYFWVTLKCCTPHISLYYKILSSKSHRYDSGWNHWIVFIFPCLHAQDWNRFFENSLVDQHIFFHVYTRHYKMHWFHSNDLYCIMFRWKNLAIAASD